MIRDFFASQLRINMFSGVATNVVNTIVLAIGYSVYLHFLGYEKYGVWLVLTTILSFAQLGNLGIGQAVTKLVAEEHGGNNLIAIQQYVTTALAVLVTSGVIVLIFIFTLRTHIVSIFKLRGENAELVLWLLPYIGCLSVYVFIVQTLNSTLSGLGRMDLANYIQSAGRIVAVSVATSLLFSGWGIKSLLIGNTLSYFFIHIVSVIFIWRIAHLRLLRLNNLSIQRGKRLISFGGGVFGGSVIGMLLSPFNKLMLSRYTGVSTIPVYEIAFNACMHVKGLVVAGLKALMPEISRIGANMTRFARDRISKINHRAVKLIFLVGIPMYGSLFIFSSPLFQVWLGERFVEALPDAFRIILVGTFLSLIGVPAYFTLLGLGLVRHCFLARAIPAVANVLIVLSIVLLRSTLSVMDVVWAIFIASGITSLYVLFQNHRNLKAMAF